MDRHTSRHALWHPFADMGGVDGDRLVITRARGIFVWDDAESDIGRIAEMIADGLTRIACSTRSVDAISAAATPVEPLGRRS